MTLLFELGTPEIILIIFAVLAFLLIIPFAVIDIFRSEHLSQGTKLIWLLIILFAPYVGAIVYLFWGRRKKSLL